MRNHRTSAALLAVLTAALVGACTEEAGDPGTITVSVSGVAGAQGKLLISEARADDGRQAAISCVPITADPFGTTVVMEAIVGPTPCEDSGPIVLDAGTYALRTVVMMGGSMTPDACADGEAIVDGDVAVTMPALGACD